MACLTACDDCKSLKCGSERPYTCALRQPLPRARSIGASKCSTKKEVAACIVCLLVSFTCFLLRKIGAILLGNVGNARNYKLW